jgi:hypothetical protein
MTLSHPLWRWLLVDITPLRESPAYRRTWIGQLVSFLGRQIPWSPCRYRFIGLPTRRSPWA